MMLSSARRGIREDPDLQSASHALCSQDLISAGFMARVSFIQLSWKQSVWVGCEVTSSTDQVSQTCTSNYLREIPVATGNKSELIWI